MNAPVLTGSIGYQSLVADGRDDNFHLSSPDGYFTGSFAPVYNAGTGLPVLLSKTLVTNNLAVRSPAIDRGDSASVFANEPSYNGVTLTSVRTAIQNLHPRAPINSFSFLNPWVEKYGPQVKRSRSVGVRMLPLEMSTSM